MSLMSLYKKLAIAGLVIFSNAAHAELSKYSLGGALGSVQPVSDGRFVDSTNSFYQVGGWIRKACDDNNSLQFGYDHLQFQSKDETVPFPSADNFTINGIHHFGEGRTRPLLGLGIGASAVTNYLNAYVDLVGVARAGVEHDFGRGVSGGLYAAYSYTGNTSRSGAGDMASVSGLVGLSIRLGGEEAKASAPAEAAAPVAEAAKVETPATEVAKEEAAIPTEQPAEFSVTEPYDLRFSLRQEAVGEEHMARIDALGEYLKQNPEATVAVEGHACTSGEPVFNEYIAQQRAASVWKVLTKKHGIAWQRIDVKGLGSSVPIGDNATLAGRKLNRRVSIKVTVAPAKSN